MNQKNARKQFDGLRGLYKPLCAAAILCAFCFASPMQAFAEQPGVMGTSQSQITVKGKVVDASGEPIIGANIMQAGTTNGTISDVDGNFTLNVPQGATLEISYIGYVTQKVKAARNLAITLKEDSELMDEVVVMGYGTTKKADLTGAVSTVKSEMITMTPSSNPMEALQGRVAGLDITKTSGRAGEGVNMQLRGTRSITASGKPLCIIDGMPGDYDKLNPNDIEDITVLKDASSTAVYGSSGANGVIIITTKKGKEGKLSVNFNTYVGFNGWSTLPEMNSVEQWLYTRQLAKTEAGGVIDDNDRIEEETAMEHLRNGEVIDWADALMQTGSTQNYSISLSGGTEKTQAYFSLNYSTENGQYKNDEYDVLSSTIRLNQNVNKWFSAGLHVQTSYTVNERTSSDLSQAMRCNPFGKLYNDDGTLNPYPVLDDNRQVNLLLNQDRDVYRNQNNGFQMYFQPYVRITPFKGFTWESRVSAAISYSTKNQYIGYGSYQFYDKAGTGAVGAPNSETADYTSASISNSRGWGYTWENILTYNFNIANDHEFTLTGVSTWSDSQSESSSSSVNGILTNTYYWTNLGSGIGTKSISSNYSMGKSLGFVGRLNYSYLGRYLFSVSVRHDANSKLAKDVRWDTFPAFSAGWRISDESFMESTSDWLSNLKLRVGYGETGAAGIDAYDSWSILQQGIMGLGSQQITSYYYPQELSNAMLTWERSKNTNIGIDASFLNNRIELTADYYITKTDGVIWKQNLPITNGGYTASSYFQINKNIAETENKGLELTLTTRNIQTRDFSWTSTLTFTSNHEEVTSLGEGAAEFITNGDYTLHVGDPIKSYRAYKMAGVWQYGEEADAAAFGKQPGDLKVDVPNMYKVSDGVWEKKYLQEDGTWATNTYNAENPYSVNADDKQMIGHESPDWTLGFQNTFTWKNFDLSIYMFWRHGQMFYYEPITWYKSGGGMFPSHFNYWTSENPSNDFPALNSSRNWTTDEYYTSLAYTDGSFFKIKNITLGYTMPQNICNKIGLTNLRVYGTITNPLIYSSNDLLKNYDPEMGGALDFPSTKQLVFGLNLSF